MSVGKYLSKITNIFNNSITIDNLKAVENILSHGGFSSNLISKILKNITLNDYPKSYTLESILYQELFNIIKDSSMQVELNHEIKPHVIFVMGINGSGKTSAVVKMSHFLAEYGWTSLLGCCDTFRDAADIQLEHHGKNYAKMIVKKTSENQTPKYVAKRSYSEAVKNDIDVVVVDTSGRLHSNVGLMQELRAIYDTFPDCITSTLVIDICSGHVARDIVETFGRYIPINSLLFTKLDVSSNYGVLFSIYDEFKIPILGITNGENANDIDNFYPDKFTKLCLSKVFKEENK